MKLLLQHNVDIDSKDIKGRTPLSYANSYAVVKRLLEAGSNADQKDEDGRTPFSHAVYCGNMEVAEAFLERRDVDINSKDNDGRSPLSRALLELCPRNMFVVRYLLEQNDLVVTEEDRDLIEESKYLRFDFSLSEEEESEGESQEESQEELSEEEGEEAGSELEQNSKATARDGSQSDSE